MAWKDAGEVSSTSQNQAEMRKVEYSGLHPSYTFSRGKRVPCCPFCKGLDPSKTDHKESGHKRNCYFTELRGKVKSLK